MTTKFFLLYTNMIFFISIKISNFNSFFYEGIMKNYFSELQLLEYNIQEKYFIICFLVLVLIPFLYKKLQDILIGILLLLLFGKYFWIFIGLIGFDLFLYYTAQYTFKRMNFKIIKIKNISAFQYYAKLFPFVGFISFFRLGVSNQIKIKKILKISFISNFYAYIFVICITNIVIFIGDNLNQIYNTRNYEVLIVWWQFLVVGIYAMGTYAFLNKKNSK